jgi:hypothetical protein
MLLPASPSVAISDGGEICHQVVAKNWVPDWSKFQFSNLKRNRKNTF